MKIHLNAIRGRQSGYWIYSTILTFKELKSLFTFIEDKSDIPPETRAQREINKKDVKNLVDYIQSENGYILPAITAELEGDSYEYQPVKDTNSAKTSMGKLVISVEYLIEVLDGQHRLAAINKLIETASEELQEEGIPVTLYEYKNLKTSQQRFSDLNKKGRKVSTNLSTLYDDRCPVADVTRSVFKDLDRLSRLTEMEKSSPRKDKLFCFIYFYQANKIIHKHLLAQKVNNLKIKSLIKTYWLVIDEFMKDWNLVYQQKETIDNIKIHTISAHSITIHALGLIGKDILVSVKDENKNNAEVIIRNSLIGLTELNFNKTHEPIIEACLNRGKIVNNRESKKLLSEYIIEEINCIQICKDLKKKN